MTATRKRWKITYRGSKDIDTFTSQTKCYDFVRALTASYATNPEGMAQHITVWVSEQDSRWQKFEEHDLAELVGVQRALAQVSRRYGR